VSDHRPNNKNSAVSYEQRFTAQEPILGPKGMAALRKVRLFNAGAGGLGSNTVLIAFRAGIETAYHADPQFVERDNLNRILAASRHLGQPKLHVLQELLLCFDRLADDRELEYVPLVHPVEHPAVRQYLDRATHIIAGQNSAESRLWLLRYAHERKKPLINVGFACSPGRFMGGEVSIYRPNRDDQGCPACISLRSGVTASSPLFYPPLMVLAGLTIHLLIAEVTNFDLWGTKRPNYYVYDGFRYLVSAYMVPRDPRCQICQR